MPDLSSPPPPVYPPIPPPPIAPIAPIAPMAPVAPKPPRKWLGRRGGLLIVAVGTVLWFGIVLFEVIVFNASEAPTNTLLIGGFTVASAFIYTMAYRLRRSDGLTVARLLVAFMVGGILAATLASPINGLDNLWSGGTSTDVSLLSLSLAGVVEELVKILIVVLVSIGVPRKNARTGLFLGGAVGFGFAAIEDVAYARTVWNDAFHAHAAALPLEIYTVVTRAVVGIFGHPLYTALLAAVLFAAIRNDRFRLTWRVVLAYLGVAFAHGFFDLSAEFVYRLTRSNLAGLTVFWLVAVAEAVVLALIWRRTSVRANRQAARSFRPAIDSDLPFLTLMLVEAANWTGTRGVTSVSLQADPFSWRYLDGWQRATDFGTVALIDGRPSGAAWARFLSSAAAGYGYVDDSIPEITLAVAAHARAEGLGHELLADLIASARALGLPGLSLSVEDGNAAARRIYLKAGFRPVGRVGNSDTMLLRLSE